MTTNHISIKSVQQMIVTQMRKKPEQTSPVQAAQYLTSCQHMLEQIAPHPNNAQRIARLHGLLFVQFANLAVRINNGTVSAMCAMHMKKSASRASPMVLRQFGIHPRP